MINIAHKLQLINNDYSKFELKTFYKQSLQTNL